MPPKKLSTSKATSESVILRMLWYEKNSIVDFILLQPTKNPIDQNKPILAVLIRQKI